MQSRHLADKEKPMIRAVLFDLDETLIDRTETMRRFLMLQHGRFPELWRHSDLSFSAACIAHQQNGYADKFAAYSAACGFLNLTDRSLPERLFADFKGCYGSKPVLFPGVSDMLSELHKHYLIGLVSNGRARVQTAKIEQAGIASFFSSICISGAFGCKKPDARIFRACLSELSVSASEAVFVGDNPLADIAPAMELGMGSVWVENEVFPAPVACDGKIKLIADLPDLLAKFDPA